MCKEIFTFINLTLYASLIFYYFEYDVRNVSTSMRYLSLPVTYG